MKQVLASACGIDCNKCPIHLRTEGVLNYWKNQNIDLDKIRCNGCKSNRDERHWSPDCEILNCCVYEKKFDNCSFCGDFPCPTLQDWANEYEHHLEALKHLKKQRGMK